MHTFLWLSDLGIVKSGNFHSIYLLIYLVVSFVLHPGLSM